MNSTYNDIIESIGKKVNRMISLYNNLNDENIKLKTENNKLLKNIETIIIERNNIENKYNTLSTSKVLTGITEDAYETKNRIEELVREIDDCIVLLDK